MDEHSRATDQIEGAYILAILYTFGYLGMMGALMFVTIPESNKEVLLTLAGIMSAAQLGIIKYYYDGSQGAAKAQIANIARASKTDTVLQDIAKSAPIVASAPIQTDTVQVDAQTAVVTEQPPKGTP